MDMTDETSTPPPAPPEPSAHAPPAVFDIEGYLNDPAAELRRCAGESWWAEAIDEKGLPLPLVLGFDHVRAMLRDRRLSPRSFTDDMIAAGMTVETAHQLTPLFRRHGDDHRNFRGLLAAAFTPRRIEHMRPVAAQVAARLADAIASGDGECEFVSAFAKPLPPEVFAVLFGLPRSDRDLLAGWAAAVTTAFVPPLSDSQILIVETAAAEMRTWCAEMIEQRRAEPTDDLIAHLVNVEVDGDHLNDVDVTAVITGFVFAGSETTKRQLTQLIIAFSEHPDSWQRLIEDPGLVPNAIEEVLRHRPIVPGLTRVAIERLDHDGIDVVAGGRVVVSIDTANHDPATFAQPDTFDISRAGAEAHLTFGWGPHFCMGAGLARVEMQEALGALVTRFGPPQLRDGADAVLSGFSTTDALEVVFPVRP